jgi:hypothetical protein
VNQGLIAPSAPLDRRYEVESALETIKRAEQHKRDPKLMSEVAKLAAEQKEILGRVARSPRVKK